MHNCACSTTARVAHLCLIRQKKLAASHCGTFYSEQIPTLSNTKKDSGDTLFVMAWMRRAPIGLYIWIFGSQLVDCSGRIKLGDRTLLEMCHWGVGTEVQKPIPGLPFFFSTRCPLPLSLPDFLSSCNALIRCKLSATAVALCLAVATLPILIIMKYIFACLPAFISVFLPFFKRRLGLK